MEIPCVRFDDLSPGGSGSFGLLDPVDIYVARRLDEVVSALQKAEEAARNGLWVAGFVTYEAAPALNPILTVRPTGLHDRMRDLPLARFQSFERNVPLDEIESPHFPAGDYNVSGWTADSTPDEYGEHLAVMGRAIMAGEVTQLKHSFRLHAAFGGDPAALYADLLLSQRGPHAVCLDAGRFRLVSVSPQGFFRRVGTTLSVRPVLGTVRRGRWLSEDQRLASSLESVVGNSYTSSLLVKEIEAELAELGELKVVAERDRYTVERLETVWQLTAELGATVGPSVALVDIFQSLFPLASLTGVPKVEAMELLAATEESGRGAYCGAIGFLVPRPDRTYDVSFNVAVRTVVVDEDEGVAEFGVGAAITNRSEVVAAFEEARIKAKVLVDRRPEFRLVAKVRVEHGEAIAAAEILDTLFASAEYFAYDASREDLEAVLAATAATTPDCIVTFYVDRQGAIETKTDPAPVWEEEPGAPELLLGAVSDRAVSTDNVYLFHDTTSTRVVEALSRLPADIDVVIIANDHGEIAGAVDGNVVALIDGTWVTPPFECGTVPRAFRNRLIESGKIVERVITRYQLAEAKQVAVIDDVQGWRTVQLVP